MHDGKALQGGTSHYFGDGFARAFDIKFLDRDNQLKYPHQTSWGVSTRIIGGIIMTHGDESGLVLPPAVAPVQVIVIPVQQHKAGVTEAAEEIRARLNKRFRASADYSDNSPGWKFSECEMKGIPLRVEIGPRDLEAGQCVLVRRDNREKIVTPLENLEEAVETQLSEMTRALYEKALANRRARTYEAQNMDEMCEIASTKAGYIKAMWCGDRACEEKLKETADVTSRCIPFGEKPIGDVCVCCGKPAKKLVFWGKAY